MRGNIVIAGVGNTAFGKLPGRDRLSLIAEATRKALDDAGVEKSMVDAVMVKTGNSDLEILYGQKVSQALGIQPKMCGSLDQGGAANIAQITNAALALDAGMIDCALVVFGDNPKTGSRAVYSRPRGDDALYGFYSTAAGYAMIHQRYKQQYKVPDEQFGAIPVAIRGYGAQNPNAQLQKAITLDDYMADPFLIAPMRRDDCCLVSDGAVAIVMMTAERAKELKIDKAVPILGLGQGQETLDVHLRKDLTRTMAEVSGKTAFAMAGLTPKDIGVAQIYDCFTITPIITLEDYGICKRGHAAAWAAEGAIALDGEMPINTSGGLLSESGTPGLQLVAELVRQMRGDANLQVAGDKPGLVSNQGGTMHTHGTMILGRPI
ncbi:thiolase family protein [Pseudooceanicola sp.]|uniref:thiolase family protein n=1 Tax=Pseudooceanicola sp. TaxID=1914328 RepID=UPI002605A618|nr:thiolase family protein [Pseudooceanicola sp.]MDF1856436.1 thiolase family protein [Pseudooceanicola sp.]